MSTHQPSTPGDAESPDENLTVTLKYAGLAVHGTAEAPFAPLVEATLTEFGRHATRWHDGFAVWLGWSPFILDARGGGEFVVQAPDWAGDPRAELTDDLTGSLWMLLAMAERCEQAGVEGEQVRFDDDVICSRGWADSAMLTATRVAHQTAGDSGWFVEPFPPKGVDQWAVDQLERVPVWWVVRERPSVGTVLGLPAGMSVVIEGESVRSVIRDEPQPDRTQGDRGKTESDLPAAGDDGGPRL